MKGHTLIELTDVNTGEVKRYEESNMFTNALDNVYNKAPYWMNNAIFRVYYYNGYTVNRFSPVYNTALGGLLLFPENIEEDPDILYAPADNKPTGIASNNSYSGADSRRGSFNSIASGPVTNGYKYVWDFNSEQANGPIKCACLTSARGGSTYYGANFFKDVSTATRRPDAPFESIGIPGGNQQYYAIGATDDAIYLNLYNSRTTIRKLNTPKYRLNLMGNALAIVDAGTIDRDGTKLIYNNQLWVIVNSANSTGNATLSIDKYDLDTFEKTTETLVVGAQLKASNQNIHTCISDGYLYLPGNANNTLFKINISNVADVSLIEGVTTSFDANATNGWAPFNGGVISPANIVEADGTVYPFSCYSDIISTDGVWALVCARYQEGFNVGATVMTPYLATINNMQGDGFVKLPTQTMRVTYIVTEDA